MKKITPEMTVIFTLCVIICLVILAILQHRDHSKKNYPPEPPPVPTGLTNVTRRSMLRTASAPKTNNFYTPSFRYAPGVNATSQWWVVQMGIMTRTQFTGWQDIAYNSTNNPIRVDKTITNALVCYRMKLTGTNAPLTLWQQMLMPSLEQTN